MGCPADMDGDGILDSDDKCPTIMGHAGNNGCPVVKKETPKRLQFATRRINLEQEMHQLKFLPIRC